MVIAEGAGAEMRRTLVTAVFSGMIGVTVFGIFLTPLFFYVIHGLVRGPAPTRSPAAIAAGEPCLTPAVGTSASVASSKG